MSSIRRAVAADLPAVARIHRHAFFTAMPHMPRLHTPAEDLAFYTTVVFPDAEIWLVEHEDSAAGFIAFRSGWIDQLYIHPDYQRRGFGTQLLRIAKPPIPLSSSGRSNAIMPPARFTNGTVFKHPA